MQKSPVLKEKVQSEAGQLLKSCLNFGQNLRLKAKQKRPINDILNKISIVREQYNLTNLSTLNSFYASFSEESF